MTIKTKLVCVDVDTDVLDAQDTNVESEMGWVADSGIHTREVIDIPASLTEARPLEAAWCLLQVKEQLQVIREAHPGIEITDALIAEHAKALIDDHEAIDQEIEWRLRDALGLEI